MVKKGNQTMSNPFLISATIPKTRTVCESKAFLTGLVKFMSKVEITKLGMLNLKLSLWIPQIVKDI
jgi:hypothetical protein